MAATRPSSPAQGFSRRCMLLLTLVSSPLSAMAQSCIPLAGSTACPAFSSASVSRDPGLVSSFPFLTFVSNVEEFDRQLNQYITTDWARQKYQQLFGCSNVNLTDTAPLYARYTASTICNAIVQNSRTPCSLSDEASKPLCADSCAQQAISEQQIVSNEQICRNPSPNAVDQIRADFTVCSLPSDSLSGDCINGSQNERDNCGYAGNLVGLCTYCAKSSPNATDTCCYNSNVTTRCEGVTLPSVTALPPLFPTATPTMDPTSTPTGDSIEAAGDAAGPGLSGGQIAGIVVGASIGLAALVGLLVFFCLYRRRRRGSNGGSVFNQPSPPRRGGPVMAVNPARAMSPSQRGYEVLPGGRVARMSALEGPSDSSSPRSGAGASGGARSRNNYTQGFSSSDEYGDTPESQTHTGRGALPPPPPLGRRTGSLSSGSGQRRHDEPVSPVTGSGGNHSSPQGAASQQSEQLTSFKDYYSNDEIHPGDRVATLWAYQPRAADEFQLERGDMLKIVGIWDDGWATGVKLSTRAEDWDPSQKKKQRDSGVSSSSEGPMPSPTPLGDIKAFPLVCVCLPERWKSLEAELSTETESSGREATRNSQ